MCSVSSNVATSERLIGSIGYLLNPDSSSIGCSTEPVDRIGTRPFDTNVTNATSQIMLRRQFLCHDLKALFLIKIALKLNYFCKKMQNF